MALSGWNASNKIRLTIDSAVVDGDLTDFPVRVSLGAAVGKTGYDTTAVFTELGANKLKIAVEIGDTGVQTYVEIESWDNAAGTAELWVLVPSISASADTLLNFYYDSTQSDNTTYVGVTGSTPGQAVWDSSFAAVYHLAQDPTGGSGCVLDSTSNARHGTPGGSMTSGDLVDGMVGKALEFDGGDDYVATPLGSNLTTGTVELVTRTTGTVAQYDSPFGNAGTTTDALSLYANNTTTLRLWDYGGAAHCSTTVTNLTAWKHLAFTTNGATLALHVLDQGLKTTESAVGLIESTSRIGEWTTSGRCWPGIIDEVRVSSVVRADAWLKATYYSNDDNLLTYQPMLTPVSAALVQYYGTGPVQQELVQEWRLLLESVLEQPWWLAHYAQSELEQGWGIKLLGQLSQPWGNAPLVQAELAQYYGDTYEPRSWLAQRYDDSLELRSVLEQVYNLPASLLAVLEQRYAVTGTEVQSVLDQGWNLHDKELLRSVLAQPWMIAAAESMLAAVAATVTIGGRSVDPYHINYELSDDQDRITGELHFADQASWLPIVEGEAVVISCAGDTIPLIVEHKRRSRTLGRAVYIVELASESILMDAPYALPLLQSYGPALASEIAQALATPFGLTVDWQTVDAQVPADVLWANNETPMQVLKKLAGDYGAVVQPALDGTIIVRPRYPVPVPAWGTASPGAILTDQDNFFTAEEQPDPRQGWNKFLVGNQNPASSREDLEEETLSKTRKQLRAYIVPWTDSGLYSLGTSKTGVVIQPLAVPAADYEIADELVEIVNGQGRTSRPIYAITDQEWQDTALGALTISEDGTITSETAGNSLLLLSYQTRFLLWQADHAQIADVQFILERTEA